MKYNLSIRDSNKTWYILPSMGGHLISYYKLTKLLNDNCIGFTCKGLEKKKPICETLDQHIEYFLNLLDPNQESYNFIGYCMGGLFITELDKYVDINQSIIINFPYRPTNLDYIITNEFKQYDNVYYQNKLIWNEWFENIYLNNTIKLKHTCCLIESYLDSNIQNKIIPNHYISMSNDVAPNHLDILNYPHINKLANYINTFCKSEIIRTNINE